MGNKCPKKTSNTTDENQEISDYDLAVYKLRREKVFYGTIAICVLYASFALLLFILSYLSPKIKFLLLNNFLPFTIVYIVGTIIIVLYLIAQVVNFKPYKIDKNIKYSNSSCPDYWNVQKIKDYTNKNANEIDNINTQFKKAYDTTTANENLYNYRCVLNEDIFNRYEIYRANKDTTATAYNGKYFFTDISTAENSYSNIPIGTAVEEKIRTKDINSNVNLYVNINDIDSSAAIKTNIFGGDGKLYYEFVKNALLMNNYKIVTTPSGLDNADANTTYAVFQRTVPLAVQADKLSPITGTDYHTMYDALNRKVNLHDFNYTEVPTNSGDPIGNKAILVSKQTGQMWPQKTTPNPATTNTASLARTDFPDTIDDASMLKHFPLICDSVYPQLLAANDELASSKNSKLDNNIFRCAYSKMCGIPWSDMNCDKYADVKKS